MKTIGLIGGMSWESSIEYYRIINETVKDRLGGFHSAKCLMTSVDFAEIEELQHSGLWDEASKLLVNAAQNLERGGADCVVLCTNTMHKLAHEIQQNVNLPFLHIADATASLINAKGMTTVGLLGTQFTMEEDFYKGRLHDKFHLNVLVPQLDERQIIHRVIYQELCLGQIHHDSKQFFKQVIVNLVNQGATGIILGCTEIGLLVKPEDSPVTLFDTTFIHAQASVDWALSN